MVSETTDTAPQKVLANATQVAASRYDWQKEALAGSSWPLNSAVIAIEFAHR